MREREYLLFEYIFIHVEVIEERFHAIEKADDFINTEQGKILLDAIAMRLQALSENVKKILKKNPDLEKQFPEADWNDIVRFRDLISHHYEMLNYQVVYSICMIQIPVLKLVIQKILSQRS